MSISDSANTGRLRHRTSVTRSPQNSPPRSSDTGIIPSPMSIPLANRGRSTPEIIPIPTGIVKVMVHPKVAPTMIPAYLPTSGVPANSMESW